MPTKIERVPLHLLQPNQLADFFAVLTERDKRAKRDGNPFFTLKFRDRYRVVGACIWENSPLFEQCEALLQPGNHYKLRAQVSDRGRFGPQLEIQNLRPVKPEDRLDGYDPDAFELSSRFNIEEMFSELLFIVETIEDEPLRKLVLGLLWKNEKIIKQLPAAAKNHHAFRGGFLEHTISVVRNGMYLVDKYREYYPDMKPPLNRDLVLAGCVLHDIGKIHELLPTTDGGAYTIPGLLVGHILIGRDMVRVEAQRIDGLNPDLLLYLDHIILSHQGTPEWGSPREPMMPEALLVHYADDVDAKMNMFFNILNTSEGEGAFTDSNNSLRRRLLRHRQV